MLDYLIQQEREARGRLRQNHDRNPSADVIRDVIKDHVFNL